MKKIFGIIVCYWLAHILVYALEIRLVSVSDSLGITRSNFSSSEKINFNVQIYNDVPVERINFTFEVYDPLGIKRFTHSGNSIPGGLGEGGSSVKNIPISSFFKDAGLYRLAVKANGVSSQTSFSVYSPNITLTYPPNNSQDLSDKPVVFRWVASGASKYRLFVDDDAAFYNCIFTADTFSSEYIYPDNPTDARQKLSSGIVYYWKVEGLDAGGNVVARCSQPFNFTIKQSATVSSSRDLAIVGIEIKDNVIVVSIKNLGSRTENNIPVTLYASGQSIGSQTIPLIAAGQIQTVLFPISLTGSVNLLAAITFEDDYSRNNILSKLVEISPPVAVSSETVAISTAPAKEIEEKVSGNPRIVWNKLKKYLPDKKLIPEVESQYEIKKVFCEKDIDAVLKLLKEGKARIVEAVLEE